MHDDEIAKALHELESSEDEDEVDIYSFSDTRLTVDMNSALDKIQNLSYEELLETLESSNSTLEEVPHVVTEESSHQIYPSTTSNDVHMSEPSLPMDCERNFDQSEPQINDSSMSLSSLFYFTLDIPRFYERVSAAVAGTWREVGEAGCGVGAAGASEGSAEQAARRRWQPPSAQRRDHADPDANHDLIFRKVRGILNKLTPEKFQKLSDDLLALDLTSDKVLKGVILLIFDKALDEPKYSSMYAQLCKRLSEEAPNLEPAGQPCTFRLLLLNKCRAEFENRALAFAAFDDKDSLTAEEEEKRHLAKCKMLGNIKFIGELGKLEILAESILHRCIQKLLARRGGGGENVDDLECLAQLVRTCGRVLDSARGKRLVDQYFARMAALAGTPSLPPRIRFMLRDVVELRRTGWVPRAAAASEPPVPIGQLRAEPAPRRDPLFRHAPRALDAVLAGLALPPAPRHDAFRHRSAPVYFPPPPPHAHQPHSNHSSHTSHTNHKQHNNHKDSGGGGGGGGGGGRRARGGGVQDVADVQMRPAANSLLFSAAGLRAAPPQPRTPTNVPTFGATPIKEPAITIKPQPEKHKPKKDKGVNKEEACKLALEACEALVGNPDAAPEDPRVRALQEMALPDKVLRRVIACVLEWGEAQGAAGGAAAAAALVRCVKRAACGELVRAAAVRAPPPPHAHRLLHAAITQKLVTLGEVGGWLEGGVQFPLLLDVLQQLNEDVGMERLKAMVSQAKLNVVGYIVSGQGSGRQDDDPTGALAALELRSLTPLEPQLRVHAALSRQLQADPSPQALYRWIKSNVDADTRAHASFISALVGALCAHVTGACASAAGDKPSVERERTLLAGYSGLLRALLHEQPPLQLAAVYATQVHAHRLRYPRGLLLRWFMYLYNLEVVEEDAFLRWREDVTDAYPGKGEALFQVNTWLTWLQQQESEDEEAED